MIRQPLRAHPHLLEVSAWPWLERLSRLHGRHTTLADVPGVEWNRLADPGFDLIYLMGVWRRSSIGRDIARRHPELQREYSAALPDWSAEDVAGSPYSIADYVPDERMGGWQGLDAARRALNARGVRLMLDFVPNHTGFDHPWVLQHPDRYVTGTADDHRTRPGEFRHVGDRFIACGRDPFFPPWTDSAQLNYFNPDTRTAMVGVLKALSARCDGVRCDMAMLPLNDVFEQVWRSTLRHNWPRPQEEFWPQAVRQAPALVYLAEVYWDLESTLQRQGFHFTYDKRLLDRLRAGSAHGVRLHLTAEASYQDRLARFLENHDEPRSAAVFLDRLPAAAVLVATQLGLRFYFDGQLTGARLRAPVQLGRWPDERLDEGVRHLYGRLLRETDGPLFHTGTWRMVDVSSAGDDSYHHLVACSWRLEDRLAVVVVNLGHATAEGRLAIAADAPLSTPIEFRDVLSDVTYHCTHESLRTSGLHVTLPAGQGQLLQPTSLASSHR
jgi:hypothetical protein